MQLFWGMTIVIVALVIAIPLTLLLARSIADPIREFGSQYFFYAAVRSASHAILTRILDGVVTSWNAVAGRPYGDAAQAAIGRHMDLTVPVLPEEGMIIGAAVVARDTADRFANERKLKEIQESLWRESRIMVSGQMATGLGHELHQPLASAVNYINAARRWMDGMEASPARRARDELGKAAVQLARMGEIIQRLRDFVHNRPTKLVPQDLNALVSEAISFARMERVTADTCITLKLAPQLPLLLLDKIQIQQAIINLVRNACEAMKDQQIRELTIGTQLKPHLGAVQLSVCDTGRGVTGAFRHRMFKPFATTKEGGMGVGLMICRSIIEAHDGAIWFTQNADGPGTTFHMRIPVAREVSDAA